VAGEEPAVLQAEEEAPQELRPGPAGLPTAELPSEELELEEGPRGEGEAILLEEVEEEAPAPPGAPLAGSRAGENLPGMPSEEEGGDDVFAVLRSERGLPEEEVSEEPIGNALLYEANEALENISEQEDVAPARLPAPGPAAAAAPPPPPPAQEEEPALPGEEPAAAAGGAAAPAAGSPADLVRKLASDHCPGDLLFAEEGEARMPAWAEGVSQAAASDLRERQAAKAAVQPEEYLRLGIVEHLLGRCEEASGHFKEALRRTRRLGPVLNALAVATFARGKVDPAIAYCKEAVREAGGDAALRCSAFRNLGFFYQVKGDHARAAEATVSAIEAIGPKGDPAQLSRLHLRAGQLLRRLGEAGQARGHLAESANHFRKGGENAEWARALVALASAQTQLGESDAALKNLEEAARVCRELGDAAGEALALGQMGGTYTALDQFTRALGYYEKAVAIHREMGNRKGEAAHMSNIGNIHYFRGDLEEAEGAYERALQINREEAHLVGQATSLGNLGRLHLEQGSLEKARARLGEARELFKEAGAEEQLDKIRAMLEEVDRARGG
jgi:tetratricopeptide (TPR) repeat protein